MWNQSKNSPSRLLYGKLDEYKTVENIESGEIRRDEVVLPEDAKSVIVIAVVHPKEEPELDWWRDGYTGGTHGNRILSAPGKACEIQLVKKPT